MFSSTTFGASIGAVAVAASALLAAPLAHADQYDFIADLDAQGVPYSNITRMIEIGKAVCHDLRAGTHPVTEKENLVQTFGVTNMEAAITVASAIVHMCPDVEGPFQQ